MNTLSFRRNFLALLGLCVSLVSGLCANPGPYDGEKWSFLDSTAALKAAAEITLAKYPDSDEATVDKKMVRSYRADGTGECQDETFLKVLTEKGKRGNRSLASTTCFLIRPRKPFESKSLNPAVTSSPSTSPPTPKK